MILSWLCFFDSLLAAALVAAGIVAAHYQLTQPFMGFQMFLVGFFFAIIAFLLGLLSLIFSRSPVARAGRPRAIFGVALSILLAVPIIAIVAQHRPVPINDITTDQLAPPQFVAAAQLPANRGRNMGYDPRDYAIQRAAYPAVQPLRLSGAPDQVFDRVAILAGEVPSWQIIRNDPKTRQLEGVGTTALFKFHDDFIIEVRPGDGGTSIVEMRSKSREGQTDLGSNSDRIVSFLQIVKTGPQLEPPGSAQIQP